MKSFSPFRLGVTAAALMLSIPAGHAVDTQSASSPRLSLVGQSGERYDGFIISYREGTTERRNSDALLQNVKAAVSRAGLDRATVSATGAQVAPLSVSHVRKLGIDADLVKTSRKLSQGEANQLIHQIAADPAVTYVQPDYLLHVVRDTAAPAALTGQVKTQTSVALQAMTPDDPDYATKQWDFSDPVGGANINNAWDLADGAGITVAVIDTGITMHDDLDTSLADDGYDFISNAFISGRGTDVRAPGGWDTGDWTNTAPWNDPIDGCASASNPPAPSSWHGTHVSGTIAALTHNGVGVAGIAYHAKVLPVRALGHCGGLTSDIVDAIAWASGGHVPDVPDNTHVAQVINMSIGGPGTCGGGSPMNTAITDAIRRGTTVVVAAGNSAVDAGQSQPASCPGVITVAATGITGKRAFYSNYGSKIALAAPGGDANDGSEGLIWSTINTGQQAPVAPGYTGYQGTSMASPHVAGAVALMLSATEAAGLPPATPTQVRTYLTESARAFPAPTDAAIGAGILDARAAIQAAVTGDNNDGGQLAKLLAKGVLLPGQGSSGKSILYAVRVPAGARTLNLRTLGGSGHLALYVKAGTAPAIHGENADFKSDKPGTSQAVVLQTPQAATYYLRVVPQDGGFTNISVLADYSL